jgi:hypothetical protein
MITPRTALLSWLFVFAPAAVNAADYRAPRTSFGQPDLQGVWTNSTLTPVERPTSLGEKLVLSEQEARAMETAMARRLAAADAPSNPETQLRAGGDPGGYNLFWMDPGTKIAFVDGQFRTSITVEPKNGRLPPFTPLGAKLNAEINDAALQRAFEGPEGRPLGERCLAAFGNASGPPMLPVIYNSNYQIVQGPNHVMIMVEMPHDVRVVHLDNKPLPDAIRPWMGHSVGRWDLQIGGGALYRRAPTSSKLKVTERFTRTGPSAIRYEFKLEDPEIFVGPWRGEMMLHQMPTPIYEYACHEGNYALPGILAGAREEEKAAAKAAQ